MKRNLTKGAKTYPNYHLCVPVNMRAGKICPKNRMSVTEISALAIEPQS